MSGSPCAEFGNGSVISVRCLRRPFSVSRFSRNVEVARRDHSRQHGADRGTQGTCPVIDGTDHSQRNQDPIWKPSKANAQGRFGLKEFILTALS